MQSPALAVVQRQEVCSLKRERFFRVKLTTRGLELRLSKVVGRIDDGGHPEGFSAFDAGVSSAELGFGTRRAP